MLKYSLNAFRTLTEDDAAEALSKFVTNSCCYGRAGKKITRQMKTKEIRERELAIFELRSWGDFVKPEHWPEHSYDMAFLFGQMAPGDLTSDKELAYFEKVRIKVQEYELLKLKVIPNSADLTRGQKTHRRLFNRSLRNKMEIKLAEIEKIRKDEYQ